MDDQTDLVNNQNVDRMMPEGGPGPEEANFSSELQREQFLGGGEKAAESSQSEERIKPLYRGIWAESIRDGDRIPVGGSVFSDEHEVFLEVDTEWMDEKTAKFTRETVDKMYQDTNEKIFSEWIEKNGIQIDPKLFNDLLQAQGMMKKILEVKGDAVAQARRDRYFEKKLAKLSEFVGESECAEQAVVGKLLLDKLGVQSVLMEGVHIDDKKDDPIDHAFLVLDDPQGEGSLVFDIARPKASLDGFPRILRTDTKIDFSTFEGKNNYVVPAKDVYNGQTVYYGVGHPTIMQEINYAE